MTVRFLWLSVLCLSLAAGCAKQSPTPEAPMPDSSKPAQPESPPVGSTATKSGLEQPSGGTPGTEAGQAQAVTYLVRDSGIRCIAPPCPSYLAVPEGDPKAEAIQIHELDFEALQPTDEKREELMRMASESPKGLKVEAVLDKQLKAGPAGDATVLRVKKVLK